AYVAGTTAHAYSQYLRERYPRRHRFKTRLRYLLLHDSTFVLWESETGRWLCGLRSGRAPSRPVGAPSAPPPDVPRDERLPPAVTVARWLEAMGQPVPFEALVSAMVELWGIKEDLAGAVSQEEPREGSVFPLDRSFTQAEDRVFLGQLWDRIQSLP